MPYMATPDQSPAEQVPEQPEQQVFNLGALSVGDIVRINLALSLEEAAQYAADIDAVSDPVVVEENEKFLTLFRRTIGGLAVENLDRAKEVVLALKSDRSRPNDGLGYSQTTAAHCAVDLARHDYEFARDTLLDIYFTRDRYNDGGASDAVLSVSEEFASRLTPEQRADFDHHWQLRQEDR